MQRCFAWDAMRARCVVKASCLRKNESIRLSPRFCMSLRTRLSKGVACPGVTPKRQRTSGDGQTDIWKSVRRPSPMCRLQTGLPERAITWAPVSVNAWRLPGRGHIRVPTFRCLHQDHHETTEDECHGCRDWTASHSGSRPLAELMGEPGHNSHANRKWAVGVTTAPRRQPTLDTCLDYLLRAGWDNVRLFVDDRVPVLASRHRQLPVTLRQPSRRSLAKLLPWLSRSCFAAIPTPRPS